MSFIAHMIISLKGNKRERVSAFKKMENFKEGTNMQLHFKNKATPYQLKRIREKLQTEKKIRTQRRIIIFVLLMILFIYAIGFVKF